MTEKNHKCPRVQEYKREVSLLAGLQKYWTSDSCRTMRLNRLCLAGTIVRWHYSVRVGRSAAMNLEGVGGNDNVPVVMKGMAEWPIFMSSSRIRVLVRWSWSLCYQHDRVTTRALLISAYVLPIALRDSVSMELRLLLTHYRPPDNIWAHTWGKRGGTEVLGEKPFPMPFDSPQTLRGQPWDRKQDSPRLR